MTSDYRNPLEVLGIPRDLLLRDREHPRRLMEIAKGYGRTLLKVYHPDITGEDTGAIVQVVSDALDDLSTPEDVQVALQWLLDEDDVEHSEAIKVFRQANRTASVELHTLLGFLPYLNQLEVLGLEHPHELFLDTTIGTDHRRRANPEGDFITAALLAAVPTVGDATLEYSVIPDIGMNTVIVGTDLSWQSQQQVWVEIFQQFKIGDDYTSQPLKDFVFEYRKRVSAGEVRIIGAVSNLELKTLAEDLYRRPAGGRIPDRALSSSPQSDAGLDQWVEPAEAWWLKVARPRARHDDVLVGLRESGDGIKLALLGTWRAERPL